MSIKPTFQDRVGLCRHQWSDNYSVRISCGTPYCSGSETRCVKCRVFKSTCGCGSENGMSGWPHKRWSKKYNGSN